MFSEKLQRNPLKDSKYLLNYTKIWVDLKIDRFFYPDFQRIATIRFSQPLRGGYIYKTQKHKNTYLFGTLLGSSSS